MNPETLSHISSSLPENFSFYGFGHVTRSERTLSREALAAILEGKSGVSFRLLGEPAALLVVLFDSSLDASMYTEMGNILASQLCQKLSEQGEGDLMITPPIALEPRHLAKLPLANYPFIHRSYEHVDQDKKVAIETLIMPLGVFGAAGSEESIGNA